MHTKLIENSNVTRRKQH